MSRKMLAVIKREYLTRFKTKGFIIGTLLFPLILVLLFSGFFIFSAIFQPSTKTYAIMDNSDSIYNEFVRIQSDTLKSGELKYNFIKKDISKEDIENLVESLKESVINQEIDGYLIIPEDIMEKRVIVYSARNISDFEEQESFSRTFSWIVTNMRLEKKNLPADEIRNVMSDSRVKLRSMQITEKGEVEKSGGAGFALCYILSYVMILMTMIYGMMTMRSVIEEKSQRITETIVSSIRPFELMMGKIIGICGLGITQLIIFGGFILFIIAYAGAMAYQLGLDLPLEVLDFIKQIHFTPQVFGFMILFFILGFVFYSSIFAAIGAMVNTEDEGQQFQGPVIMLIWVGFFILLAIAKNPETTKAFWISLFPLYTPFLMFARIVVSDPILPSGVYLSIFTMIGSTAVLIWLVSKIYRIGILMYGKKPSLKEAIKWIRYK